MGSLALTAGRGFLGVPVAPSNPQERGEWERSVSMCINLVLLQGKLNCTGSATLRQNQRTTTISDARITTASVILPMATNATSAAALSPAAEAGWFVAPASLIEGSFILTHGSTSTADCLIYYAIIG